MPRPTPQKRKAQSLINNSIPVNNQPPYYPYLIYKDQEEINSTFIFNTKDGNKITHIKDQDMTIFDAGAQGGATSNYVKKAGSDIRINLPMDQILNNYDIKNAYFNISHQDLDHISFLPSIADTINNYNKTKKKQITIKQVNYTGAKKINNNIQDTTKIQKFLDKLDNYNSAGTLVTEGVNHFNNVPVDYKKSSLKFVDHTLLLCLKQEIN